jgi:aminodeoxyfutalosine deaminase
LVLLRAGWVVPVSGPAIRDGIVAVESGRVAWVGAADAPDRPPAEERDLGPGVLLPGFVNAHCHLELSYLAGAVPGAGGFSDWVGKLVAQRVGESGDGLRSAADLAARAMVAAGTVAVGDISNRLAHLDLMAAAGLRAVVFHELIGWDPGRAQDVLSAAEAALRSLTPQAGIEVKLAAHAPYSVSPALFAALRAHGGPACVHLAESPDEVRFLRTGDGPWVDFLASRGLDQVPFTAPGTSPVKYLDDLGVLHPRLLAVHCVQVDVEDARLLAARGVSVAVCPRSNRHIGVGTPPVPELLAAGVNVCVGTDSLASAPTLDVLADVRALHATFPQIAPATLIEMATRNGARALGLDDLGTLEPGQIGALAFMPSDRRLKDPLAYVLHSEAKATSLAC